MHKDEFRRIREDSHRTLAEIASYLRVHLRSVQKYEAGDRKIPGPVAKLMEILDAETQARRSGR